MTQQPSVSVLMTVRDEEAYLPAALTSLQRQSLSNWELVVVDDGSTDSTPEILGRFSQSDSRILAISQPTRGIVSALNIGLPHCRSNLIARMDGDDICHPERLKRQTQYLQSNPDVDLVTCRIRYFPQRIISEGLRSYENWINGLITHEEIMRDRFVESPLVQASVMLRRAGLDAVGGYRENHWLEDYDLWLRMAEYGCRFARLPQTLFFWRDHADRVTRTRANCSREAFRDCKVHYLQRGPLNGVEEVTIWGAGTEGKAWRKTLGQFDIRVSRWVDIDPRKIGQMIHEAPVVTPENLKPGNGLVLIAVGTRGSRAEIRETCRSLRLLEGTDFIFVT